MLYIKSKKDKSMAFKYKTKVFVPSAEFENLNLKELRFKTKDEFFKYAGDLWGVRVCGHWNVGMNCFFGKPLLKCGNIQEKRGAPHLVNLITSSISWVVSAEMLIPINMGLTEKLEFVYSCLQKRKMSTDMVEALIRKIRKRIKPTAQELQEINKLYTSL